VLRNERSFFNLHGVETQNWQRELCLTTFLECSDIVPDGFFRKTEKKGKAERFGSIVAPTRFVFCDSRGTCVRSVVSSRENRQRQRQRHVSGKLIRVEARTHCRERTNGKSRRSLAGCSALVSMTLDGSVVSSPKILMSLTAVNRFK